MRTDALDAARRNVLTFLADPDGCAETAREELAALWASDLDRKWVCAGLCARITQPDLEDDDAPAFLAERLASACGIPDSGCLQDVLPALILTLPIDLPPEASECWPALVRRAAEEFELDVAVATPSTGVHERFLASVVFEVITAGWTPAAEHRCRDLKRRYPWLGAIASSARLTTLLRRARHQAPPDPWLRFSVRVRQLLESMDLGGLHRLLRLMDETTNDELVGTPAVEAAGERITWNFEVPVEWRRRLALVVDDEAALGGFELVPAGGGHLRLENGWGVLSTLTEHGPRAIRAARAAASEVSWPIDETLDSHVRIRARAFPSVCIVELLWNR